MKKLLFLIAAAVSLASCGTQVIVPKALNTVNSVSLDELNLEREDYDILNTITAEAVVIYRERGSKIEIIDQNNEFSLSYTKSKTGITIPPMAATIGSNACLIEVNSPTSTSRFISSPMVKKKMAIKASLINAMTVIGSPP